MRQQSLNERSHRWRSIFAANAGSPLDQLNFLLTPIKDQLKTMFMRHLEWQNSQYHEFGPFRLALDEHRLYRNGEVVGGEAMQMTRQGGFEPMESPDGRWIYFMQDRGSSSIWRMPTAGGAEEPLFDFHQKNYSRSWAVTDEGVYFAAASSRIQD
jgi:hypothetical protein